MFTIPLEILQHFTGIFTKLGLVDACWICKMLIMTNMGVAFDMAAFNKVLASFIYQKCRHNMYD